MLAEGYNVYYSLAGMYSLITNTMNTSCKDGRLTSSREYCYAVTSVTTCDDQTVEETAYSNEYCITAQ